MAKFCSNCGSSVEEDWNVCPNCGQKIIVRSIGDIKSVSEDISKPMSPPSVVPIYKPPETSFMSKPTHKYWTLSLIAGILSLIALVTPSAYKIYGMGAAFLGFIFGFMVLFQFGYGMISGWTTSTGELIISIISTILILTSAIIIIVKSAKLKKSGIQYSNMVLVFGILAMVGALHYIIAFDIFSRLTGYGSFWGNASIGPALFLQFVVFILVVIGYSIGKKRS